MRCARFSFSSGKQPAPFSFMVDSLLMQAVFFLKPNPMSVRHLEQAG
jgi:hypothetical protein